MGPADEISKSAGAGGSATASAGSDQDSDDPVEHEYVFLAFGIGEGFLAEIILNTNVVTGTHESDAPIHDHVIGAALHPEDTTWYGENIIAHFKKTSGPGALLIELWRDDVLHDSKTIIVNGNQVTFNADF